MSDTPKLKLRDATESVGWLNSEGPLSVSPTFDAATPDPAGLVEEVARLTLERDEARAIVADVNNAVIGSQGYFTTPSCVEAIDKLKEHSNRTVRRAETAEEEVARLQAELDVVQGWATKWDAMAVAALQVRAENAEAEVRLERRLRAMDAAEHLDELAVLRQKVAAPLHEAPPPPQPEPFDVGMIAASLHNWAKDLRTITETELVGGPAYEQIRSLAADLDLNADALHPESALPLPPPTQETK